MLSQLSIISNVLFMQCIQTLIDDGSLDINVVVLMKKCNELNIPVMVTGSDDYNESHLFKFLEERKLTTAKYIFVSTDKDISYNHIKQYAELKKPTIFANLTSGEIKVTSFGKFEIESELLGTCSDTPSLKESLKSLSKEWKKWKNETATACYTFDPPFTMNHSSPTRRGLVLNVHEMIHDLIGVRVVFKKESLLEMGKKGGTEKRLQELMESGLCDYFLQGTFGRLENKYDFTTPSFSDALCWYAPTSNLIPKWKYVYQILSSTVWIFWISTTLMLFLLWYGVGGILLENFTSIKFLEKFSIIYEALVEQGGFENPKNTTECIIVCALILQSFIMSVAYKCKFIEFISIDNYDNQLDSIEEVMEYNLNIGFLPILIDLFSKEEKMKDYLEDHYVPCDFTFSCIDRTANVKDMIVLRARSKIIYNAKRYTDADGKFKLKTFGGTVTDMTFNSIFTRGHPLYPLVEKELLNLLAHGFVHKITKDYLLVEKVLEESVQQQALNLMHLKVSILILLIGWAVSGACFMWEIYGIPYILPYSKRISSIYRNPNQ